MFRLAIFATLLFTVLKLAGVLAISWWLVLSPVWIFAIWAFVGFCAVLGVAVLGEK